MTAWSRRLNAASRVGAAAGPKPEVLNQAVEAGVDENGMATLRALVNLARERPGYVSAVEVMTAEAGLVRFKVSAGPAGLVVEREHAGHQGGDAGQGTEILQVLTDTMVETPDLVAVFAAVGHEALWANDAFVTSIPIRQADKIWLVELLDEWSKGHYEVKVLPALVKFGRWRGRLTLLTGADEVTEVSAVIVAHRDREGDIAAVSMVARPLEVIVDAATSESDRGFAALVESSSDIIAVLDGEGVVTYASPAMARVLGCEAGDLVGRALLDLAPANDRPEQVRDLVRVDDLGVGEPSELRLLAADGGIRHLEVIVSDLTDNPVIGGLVLNGRDVTERVTGVSEVAARAYTDALTGLPGRVRVLDRISAGLVEAGEPVTVVLLDVDRLTGVNETYGRDLGDEVLRSLAARLADAIEPGQFAGRLGSDEFVVVLPGGEVAEGTRVANRLRAVLAQPLDVGGVPIEMTVSVGVATAAPGDEADEVLGNAGRASAHAKASGRDRVEVFTEQLAAIASRRRIAEQQLRQALDHEGVGVHYQPIIDVNTGAAIGAEALLRVESADGAHLSPAEFIEAAESTGLIARLGRQVLQITCEQLTTWTMGKGPDLQLISVNVSPRQLADPDLPSKIVDTLNGAGVAPERLCLEIGESILISAQSTVDATISYLRALGVRIGLDDFGAGQSSLGYLKRFPLDFVKIDRTLIAGLGTDEQDTAIVRATIELAHNLGLQVVAVGVEFEEQLEMLKILGCDRAQGYLFAPPLPAAEFASRAAAGFR